MDKIRIIQSSPARTGSTLLLNLIYGFLSPNEPIHSGTEKFIDKYLITKTHNQNIDNFIKQYPNYKLYFIMSERNDKRVSKLINDKYRDYNNVLIINYDQINNNNLDDVVSNTFNIFLDFLPSEIIPKKNHNLIKEEMKKRIINMNKLCKEIKNKPFSYWNKFYGIHGNHRNRD